MFAVVVLVALLSLRATEGAEVIDLTDGDFDKKTAEGTWFVEFFAPWCHNCRDLEPTWQLLPNALPGINIAKVDCTIHDQTCRRWQIRGYPTLRLIRNGYFIQFSGGRSLEALSEFATHGDTMQGWPVPDNPFRTPPPPSPPKDARDAEEHARENAKDAGKDAVKDAAKDAAKDGAKTEEKHDETGERAHDEQAEEERVEEDAPVVDAEEIQAQAEEEGGGGEVQGEGGEGGDGGEEQPDEGAGERHEQHRELLRRDAPDLEDHEPPRRRRHRGQREEWTNKDRQRLEEEMARLQAGVRRMELEHEEDVKQMKVKNARSLEAAMKNGCSTIWPVTFGVILGVFLGGICGFLLGRLTTSRFFAKPMKLV